MERHIFKQEGEKFKFIFSKDHPGVSVKIRERRQAERSFRQEFKLNQGKQR